MTNGASHDKAVQHGELLHQQYKDNIYMFRVTFYFRNKYKYVCMYKDFNISNYLKI